MNVDTWIQTDDLVIGRIMTIYSDSTINLKTIAYILREEKLEKINKNKSDRKSESYLVTNNI